MRKQGNTDTINTREGIVDTAAKRRNKTIAVANALRNGEAIEFRTEGTGTNSANMPLLAIGNVAMNGTNPPKYLNAEFNFIEVCIDGAKPIKVKNGARVKGKSIKIRANVGNLQEAGWLKPIDNCEGGVVLNVIGTEKVSAPIMGNTVYLADTETDWVELKNSGEYLLQMEAIKRSSFGEIWKIIVE